MYAKGEGVPLDNVKAYAWLAVSAVNGNNQAVANKVQVQTRLSEKKLTEAESLALTYYTQYQSRPLQDTR